MLAYRSTTTGSSYMATIRAARLVSETGSSGLPAPFGEVEFKLLDDPIRFGLPARHPVHELYPHLTIQYYLMVVTQNIMVERAGVRGVSLYADYRGSDVCAEVTSEMGRNGVAPWNWNGDPGTPTDAAATPFLEWRRVAEDGTMFTWQNHMIHGVEPRGLDWRDGVPVNLRYMHDPNRGEVLQSILVPAGIPGLGNAEQTIDPAALTKFYTIMLWFPRPEYMHLVQRAPGSDRRGVGYQAYGGGLESLTAKDMNERGATRSAPPQAEFKLASGGRIKQHVIPNPFSSRMMADAPEVMFVGIPVGEQQADRLLRPNMPTGRKTF